MVAIEELEHALKRGLALFPGYPTLPEGAHAMGLMHFHNDYLRPGSPGNFEQIEYWTVLHTSFDASWPIAPDLAASIAGVRRAIGLPQVHFAQALKVGRATVERWEKGLSQPYHGDTYELLHQLRPLVRTGAAAGQLLNIAACIVLPHMTDPAATYYAADMAGHLRRGRKDDSDLTVGLIQALMVSQILLPLDLDAGDEAEEYISPAGVRTLHRLIKTWHADLVETADALTDTDRQLWLNVGHRLAGREEHD